ncbi:MAG: LuxR C-terminal-related transcriptional regulator [Spirochaetales bacterium]|nr:LuxR C-terminal-related transcriptional regulator [Spirochaetales bacterium]
MVQNDDLDEIFKTQRRISDLQILFGCTVILSKIVTLGIIRHYSIFQFFTNFSFNLSIFVTFMIFVTRKINHNINRLLQISLILLISFFATLDSYNSFYGLGFFILAVIISFKFGFLNQYPKTILFVAGILFAALVEYSVWRNKIGNIGVSFSVDLFLAVFLSLIYIIYKNDIEKIEKKKNNLEKSLSGLITERVQLEAELAKKTAELTAFEKKIEEAYQKDSGNFDDLRGIYNLTKKELELLIIIYETGKSNIEIAEDLHITVGTVKQHLNRAYSKLNVRSRTQVQAMMREFQSTGILPDSWTEGARA